tara:strand:+ start:755 stop:1126 length:372 start_codon:yes stop_codon:yes gene_type:complete
MIYNTFEGRNGTWKVSQKGNLEITLTDEGREEAEEHKSKTDDQFLWEMFEDIFCDSEFELLQPEDVGALTDSVILAFSVPRNDDGDIQEFDEDTKVWWFPNYMIHSICDVLLTDEKVFLTYAE